MQNQELYNYADSIASVYYKKHHDTYEKDAVSLSDLKQEAKIVCFKILKKYLKKHGKKGFNIKKFLSRAVGWRMRDLLLGAIVQNKNTVHIEEIRFPDETNENTSYTPDRWNIIEYSHWDKEEFFKDLDPVITYGFKVEELFKHFEGNDLTILKCMLEYKSPQEIKKILKYKTSGSVREAWVNRIKPKLLILLKKVIKEQGITI
jgi:hypothetical protein